MRSEALLGLVAIFTFPLSPTLANKLVEEGLRELKSVCPAPKTVTVTETAGEKTSATEPTKAPVVTVTVTEPANWVGTSTEVLMTTATDVLTLLGPTTRSAKNEGPDAGVYAPSSWSLPDSGGGNSAHPIVTVTETITESSVSSHPVKSSYGLTSVTPSDTATTTEFITSFSTEIITVSGGEVSSSVAAFTSAAPNRGTSSISSLQRLSSTADSTSVPSSSLHMTPVSTTSVNGTAPSSSHPSAALPTTPSSALTMTTAFGNHTRGHHIVTGHHRNMTKSRHGHENKTSTLATASISNANLSSAAASTVVITTVAAANSSVGILTSQTFKSVSALSTVRPVNTTTCTDTTTVANATATLSVPTTSAAAATGTYSSVQSSKTTCTEEATSNNATVKSTPFKTSTTASHGNSSTVTTLTPGTAASSFSLASINTSSWITASTTVYNTLQPVTTTIVTSVYPSTNKSVASSTNSSDFLSRSVSIPKRADSCTDESSSKVATFSPSTVNPVASSFSLLSINTSTWSTSFSAERGKRSVGATVSATINGHVVMWVNEWTGAPAATIIAMPTDMAGTPLMPVPLPTHSATSTATSEFVPVIGSPFTSLPVNTLSSYPYGSWTVISPTLPKGTASSSTVEATETANPDCLATELGNFVISFDDLPIYGEPAGKDLYPPIRSPYESLFWSEGFSYVPPPNDKYLPTSGKQLGIFIVDSNANVHSQNYTGPIPSVDDVNGMFGAGPNFAQSAFWFDAHSAAVGCNLDAQSECIVAVHGWKLDDETGQSVQQVHKNYTLYPCATSSGCDLQPIELDSTFQNLTALQLVATAVGDNVPVTWYIDDLALTWSNDTCAAVKERNNVY